MEMIHLFIEEKSEGLRHGISQGDLAAAFNPRQLKVQVRSRRSRPQRRFSLRPSW